MGIETYAVIVTFVCVFGFAGLIISHCSKNRTICLARQDAQLCRDWWTKTQAQVYELQEKLDLIGHVAGNKE